MNDAHMKSGMAVQECISILNPTPVQFLKAEATLIPDDPSHGQGSIFITFQRRDFHDFPIITCDDGVMKSYGIPHGSFDPNFNIFTFTREGMKLQLVAKKDGFVLKDIRLV